MKKCLKKLKKLVLKSSDFDHNDDYEPNEPRKKCSRISYFSPNQFMPLSFKLSFPYLKGQHLLP